MLLKTSRRRLLVKARRKVNFFGRKLAAGAVIQLVTKVCKVTQLQKAALNPGLGAGPAPSRSESIAPSEIYDSHRIRLARFLDLSHLGIRQ